MRFFKILSLSALSFSLCQCDKPAEQKKSGQGPDLSRFTDDSESSKQEPKTAELEFPYQAKLVNAEGKSLEVTLLGRSKGSVTFSKLGSNKAIDYPIPNLSLESAQLVKRFPVQSYSSNTSSNSYNEKKIAFLEKRCDELKADMQRYEKGSLKYKSIEKKLKATEAEIKEFE